MKEKDPLFSGILASYGTLLRAILLIFATALILVGVAEYLFQRILSAQSDIGVEFTDQGTTLLKFGRSEQRIVLLPASAVWEHTGLRVKPKRRVRIVASGRANLAVHRLVDAAKGDILPISRWTDPDGLPPEDHEVLDLLVKPGSNIGALLAYFHPGGTPPSLTNIRPGRIFTVGKEREITNPHDTVAELWLIINDLFFDPNDLDRIKKIYVGKGEGKMTQDREAAFEQIVKLQFWNYWWEDNIGSYFVQIGKK